MAGLGRYIRGLRCDDEGIALTFQKSAESAVREAYRGLLHDRPDVEQLASNYQERVIEKYEPFLSDAFQSQVFASHCLDLDGAIRTVVTLD